MNLINIIILSIILIITIMTISYAKNSKPHLVIDMLDTTEPPGHFRTTSMPLPNGIEATGFADLHSIGSRQYSQKSLEAVIQKLHIPHLFIIDLRQESHGFLNGVAISWYGKQDSTNAGKTPEEIEKEQAKLLRKLSKRKQVTVYEIVSKNEDGEIDKVNPVDISVEKVVSESEWVTNNQMIYHRFYVQDFHPPTPSEVDRFIKIANQIPQGTWVYFHCRGGSGRSTTFMTMYDMMHNANKVSFRDILARQAAIGGKDFSHLPTPGTYKYKPALKRLMFIKNFYRYCQANDQFKMSFSEWVNKNHDNENFFIPSSTGDG